MRYFFVLMVALFLSNALEAQIKINLYNQPIWGPTGYDYVEYYYLPDMEVYYYVPQHRFYYNEGGNWISRSSLPSRFSNYNFYNSYKVVVNESKPWRNHKVYKEKYLSYKGRHDQEVIRDSRDSKYFVNKNHPEHSNWVQQQKYDDGRNKVDKQNNNKGKHNSGKNKK